MVLDRNHCYVAVNRAYEQVVMRGRDELIGRNLFDLFPNDGESGRRLRDSFNRVIETGEPDTLAYIPYDLPRPPAFGRVAHLVGRDRAEAHHQEDEAEHQQTLGILARKARAPCLAARVGLGLAAGQMVEPGIVRVHRPFPQPPGAP